MKRILFILIASFTVLSFGQTTRKYSNEFLNIGVDAAALGMGNAVTAFSADVNSGYWNPAGLVNIEDKQIALMHASYFANIANYDYLAFAMPLDDKSAIGLSLIRFGVDDIIDTRALIDSGGNITPYAELPRFSAADYALTFSYSRSLPIPGFNYGINAKVVRRIIGDFASSWGFGLDAAIQFENQKNWKFGIMARDITTTFNAWAIEDDIFDAVENEEIPQQEVPESTEITIPKLQLGIAKKFIYRHDFSILTELDLNVRFEENNDIISTSFASINPAFGFEVGYIDMVYLRGGVSNFQMEEQLNESEKLGFQPSFGVGFKYKGIQIDYAFTDIGDQSVALYSNVFSLKMDLGIFR